MQGILWQEGEFMRYFMTMLTVLGLDLGTKKWVEKSLPLGGRKVIVKNHLYLRHIKNRGMAYNTFSGKRKAILLSDRKSVV